ncbi:unnamed protein product [Aureobasidium uvarum]|uniref:Uncharacterized protein n=1 Tax=Aureobasidium uvarum TaxID=2773716 RepID=A0A9N8K850_9PEZI|nr:unnamed protein product [Aureobasidium uvarum]
MSSTPTNSQDFDPPPPYSATTTNPSTSNATITNTTAATPSSHMTTQPAIPEYLISSQWQHLNKHIPNHYWIKITRDVASATLTQVHCGISRYQDDIEGPDCFFTCDLQPRTPDTSKFELIVLCAHIARNARGHRGWPKEYCGCNFGDIKQGVSCNKDGACWVDRALQWFDAWLVRRWMRQHDGLCCCRCFNVENLSCELPLYSRV